MQHDDAPLPGFEPMQRKGFVQHCTGVYLNAETGVMAARIRQEHLNPLNIAHGGFLATLIDTAFGRALMRAAGSEMPPATVSLTVDYLAPARPGAWVEAHVEVHRVGRTLSHASLALLDGDQPIARGKAIFIGNAPSLHGRVSG
ncbi:hypothetical protein D9M71_378000 [compost metagenome]